MDTEVTLGEIIMFLGALMFLGLNMFMFLENGFRIKPKEGETISPTQTSFRLMVITIDLILLCVFLGMLINIISINWDLVILP